MWCIALIPGKYLCLEFWLLANTFLKTQKKRSLQEFLQEDYFVWKSLGGTTTLSRKESERRHAKLKRGLFG